MDYIIIKNNERITQLKTFLKLEYNVLNRLMSLDLSKIESFKRIFIKIFISIFLIVWRDRKFRCFKSGFYNQFWKWNYKFLHIHKLNKMDIIVIENYGSS